MPSSAEIMPKLAALFYYQSPEMQKGISFENLEPEKQKQFLSLAAAALINLEKLNLRAVANVTTNQEEVETLLKSRIEAVVKDFFASVKVWKKGLVPEAELVERIFSIWKNL